jgi:signal transduction histidine kinase
MNLKLKFALAVILLISLMMFLVTIMLLDFQKRLITDRTETKSLVLVQEDMKELRDRLISITALALIIGIMGAVALAQFFTRPLLQLRKKMLKLQEGDLTVEIENKNLIKCWERLNCTKKDCPSFGAQDLRCWMVSGTFCMDEIRGEFAKKLGDCRKCIVYKEACGDEIGELKEGFNMMVKNLRYNLKRLEEANREKERLDRFRSLGEMSARVAHEIKNPLNAIEGAASYISKNFKGELLNEFTGIIKEEVERLNKLTTGLLSFSKPALPQKSLGDINELIEKTIQLLKDEMRNAEIQIELNLDRTIPYFYFDKGQMKQVLINLMVNAIEATPAEGSITFFSEMVNGMVSVHLKDTGMGIKKEDLTNIFKPFFTTKTRGSGLGLAIAERIIRNHDGKISVESREGKGTCFTISLPLMEKL